MAKYDPAARKAFVEGIYDPAASKKKPRPGYTVADHMRLHRYGMEKGEYERLLELQDGKCAICTKVTKLHVDHCHTTSVVRGLLCSSCNTAIGHFGESEEILTSAINYLRK
jgi:hypothetical protein